jgi:MFS family permease
MVWNSSSTQTEVESATSDFHVAGPVCLPAGFHLLWSGQLVSLIGSQLSTLAIQIIAVKSLHAGAMEMGFVTASQTLPYLLFSLIIGVVVDRISRRGLLIGADLVRFVTLLIASALAAWSHLTIPLLCGIVCLTGLFNLIFDAALGALIPELFNARQRLIANSRLSVSLTGSEVVGPSMAGFLLQTISVTGIMMVDAATYFVSALFVVLAIPRQKNMRALVGLDASNSPALNVMSELRAGVRFVWFHPVLRTFAIWSAVWNFSWSAVLSVFVLYASGTLMIPSALIGLVVAVGAMGGVCGAYAAPLFRRRWSTGKVLLTTPIIGATGGAILLLGRLGHPVVVLSAGLFLYSLGESSFGVNMQTCRQDVTPIELLGRMDTTMRFCFRGMASLGALAGGFVGAKLGIFLALAFGVSGLFVTVAGLRYSRLKEI